MKTWINDLLFLIGMMVAAYGVYLIYKPAAFLFVGLLMIGVSVYAARR